MILTSQFIKNYLNKEVIKTALALSIKKLNPYNMVHNPVMCIVYLTAIFMLVLPYLNLLEQERIQDPAWFTITIAVFIWMIVIISLFAEACAEASSKNYAEQLKTMRKHYIANKIQADGSIVPISSVLLKPGECVIVSAGEVIPCNGIVIQGIATVDESAITGESAPVIRQGEQGNSIVTYGTKVLSDNIIIRVTSADEQSIAEQMLPVLNSASSRKTENEVALTYFIAGIGVILITLTICLLLISISWGIKVSLVTFAALLICVLPTTIGALIATISISGMEKMFKRNLMVLNNRVVELAGDLDCVLFDKTGTITFGNRTAYELIPLPGVNMEKLLEAAEICSIHDQTAEGQSIISFIKSNYSLKISATEYNKIKFSPFSAETNASNCSYNSKFIIKGSISALNSYLATFQQALSAHTLEIITKCGEEGSTPLIVAMDQEVLGVIKLRDSIRPGFKERMQRLYSLGVDVIMVTGDNFYTSRTIANEIGIENFVHEAVPEKKIQLIKSLQAQGKVVAMIGDGINDAFAISQADVGYVTNNSLQELRDVAKIIDLDNDPTKIIEVIEIGRQINMTKGCINTFSLFNDFAKYFAILPAIFTEAYPALERINIMHLASERSAILSAIIFNAIIIIAMLPIALKGVRYQAMSATRTAKKFLLVFGIGGMLAPFIGIKLIDIMVSWVLS